MSILAGIKRKSLKKTAARQKKKKWGSFEWSLAKLAIEPFQLAKGEGSFWGFRGKVLE